MDAPKKQAAAAPGGDSGSEDRVFVPTPEKQQYLDALKKRLSSGPVDTLEIARAILEVGNGPWNGMVSGRKGDMVVVKSTRCPAGKQATEVGIPISQLCTCHQAAWSYMTQTIDPRIAFRLTKTLGAGDDCCEWVMTYM